MSDPDADPKTQTFTAEYVQQLRDEAAGHRLKAQETQQKLDAANAEIGQVKAKLETTDAARIAAESAALEARTSAEQRVVSVELKAAAQAQGLIDADDLRLLDTGKLKLNDKGEVEGLTAAIETLKTAKPHLFRSPDQPPTTTTSNPNPPPPPKAPGPKHALEMSPQEYASERAKLTGSTARQLV